MNKLCQLYDEQGRPLDAKGGTKEEIYSGKLHGSSHVWIWRRNKDSAEILLQKRAQDKRTWPGKFDISAAGHIDLGEDPLTAAIREAKEEINLNIAPTDLKLINVHRSHIQTDHGDIENEFAFVYILELAKNSHFELKHDEVESLEWKDLKDFAQEVTYSLENYVPHSLFYYMTLVANIEEELSPSF